MRKKGIQARHRRRYKATTDSRHDLPVASNLLERNFAPETPNQVWTVDLPYIWTDEGWLYLAVVLDLFNREVIGWSIKPPMTADIVVDALTMAWFRRKPAPGLIHPSQRSSQYASHAFQSRLAEYSMICSMSRKGNCWDNAPTKRFFNSLKNERVHGTRYATREAQWPTCSMTLKRFTTGDAATPRSRASRRFSSCSTGSALSMSSIWQDETRLLEDEKPREAHHNIGGIANLTDLPPGGGRHRLRLRPRQSASRCLVPASLRPALR
jgi:transposase InsO family protein